MKQLILLAGLHKTATTSIQETCAANQNLLSRQGLTYPTFAAPEHLSASNHTRIFKWFRNDPGRAGLSQQFVSTDKDFNQRDCELMKLKLAGFVARLPDGALMAAEGVSLFSTQELALLKDWWTREGWSIQIICHVRHLSGWMNSMMAQRVSSGMALSIAQAIDEYVQYASIVRRRIGNLREVFPNARFYSHEKALQHAAGPVGFFLQNLGIAPNLPIRFVRANEGSSDLSTRVLSLVNERYGRFAESGELNPRFFGRPQFIDAVKRLGGRKFTLRTAEVEPLMPLLQADNEWLKKTLGDDFHDPRLAFDGRRCDWTADSLDQLRRIIAAGPPPVRNWIVNNIGRLDIDPTMLAPTA